jgi:hypothetical protein
VRQLQGGDLQLEAQLVGLGYPSDFRAELFGGSSGEALEWVSVTPYVGPAHVGKVGRERYLRKAIRSEWCRWRPEQFSEVEDVPIKTNIDQEPAWAGRDRLSTAGGVLGSATMATAGLSACTG